MAAQGQDFKVKSGPIPYKYNLDTPPFTCLKLKQAIEADPKKMRGDIKLERIILTYNGQVLADDYTFNPSRYSYEVSMTLAGAKKKDGGSSSAGEKKEGGGEKKATITRKPDLVLVRPAGSSDASSDGPVVTKIEQFDVQVVLTFSTAAAADDAVATFAETYGLQDSMAAQIEKEREELKRLQETIERKRAFLEKAQANAKSERDKATLEKLIKDLDGKDDDPDFVFFLQCRQHNYKKKMEVNAANLGKLMNIISNKFPVPPAGSEMQLKDKDKVLYDSSTVETLDDTLTVESLGIKEKSTITLEWLSPEGEGSDEDDGEGAEGEEEDLEVVEDDAVEEEQVVVKKKGGEKFKPSKRK